MEWLSNAIVSVLIWFGVLTPTLGATPALTAFQGGTGTSSPQGILYGDQTIRLKTVVIGSGLSFSGGTLSNTASSFSYPFPSNATTTGLGLYASTTIGATTQATGLTISGGATTTGFLKVQGTSASSTFAAGVSMTAIDTTSGSATSTMRGLRISSGGLSISSLGTGLTISSSGNIGLYLGTACTNQVIEDLDASGAANCVSINNGYWSGTDLAVANGGTGLSTFGGTNTLLYTTAADTLSSEAALTYAPSTDLLTVVNASTTRLTWGSAISTLMSTGAGGIGTTSPWAAWTLDRTGIASSSILVTEYAISTTTNKTIDCRDANSQLFRMGTAAVTITLSGFVAGTQCKLVVCNPNGTAGTITWATSPSGILQWSGGTAPTQTTTANKCDVYSFIGTQSTSTDTGKLNKIFGAQTTF